MPLLFDIIGLIVGVNVVAGNVVISGVIGGGGAHAEEV